MTEFTFVHALLIAGVALGLTGVIVLLWLGTVFRELKKSVDALPAQVLGGLHTGLMDQSDRVGAHLNDSGDRLRSAVWQELTSTRETLHGLQLAMTEKLSETAGVLNARIDERLDQIAGKVNERLDEGFRKTNETFLSVMQRLATIDEAQKKIESLTGSVVDLQELLGDKRSRGAFGEVQLEALVRNLLPPSAFEFQCTLSNGSRVDCVLRLPDPTGLVAVDSKFPLENYHRMFEAGTNEVDRSLAQRQFRNDVRRHVDDICRKYIIADETSDGAVMFVPAEAVFAEIHAYHGELVDYAQSKRVWIVSPTTLMAVLNTARAVLKDVETRKQIHIIKDSLVRLGADFRRFDDRMKKLADHIRQAHEDAEDVHTSSRKISQQFARIESADVGALSDDAPRPIARVVPIDVEKAG